MMFNSCFAESREVNLTIAYKYVNFAGKISKAIAINNQIPGPTLHFRQGDQVTINVRNRLDEEAALHWHGVLVPWQMDGVKGVSQQGIPAHGCFQYKFTLHQSGTYWYHSHAGLEEQQGLYGAFIIDPPTHPGYQYTKDYVVVLSDWSNTNADQVMANLKKEGDYYSPRFPLQPSLAKFIHDYRPGSIEERKQLLADYKGMQQTRMSIYDISDVAYDAFLLNGQSKCHPWRASVKVGDIVRLRFIGAGAATIFKVKVPDSIMQMVHVQGNDIKPHEVSAFTIAPGETVDVLVKIEKNQPYIIYAESSDTVGAAYGALVSSPEQYVNYESVRPFPEPLPVNRKMMEFMMAEMNHEHMNHSMKMPTEPSIIGDKFSAPHNHYKTSSGTKYEKMTAAVMTNNPDKPIAKTIKMELFGDMDRFIWFINGTPEYKAKPIVLEPDKRYRFVFTNTSMMHHPMHIHGHWFILRKGDHAYDPLLHTIDVPPGATITADVDTDASGQWFFHCHMLYHMAAGMARVFQYSTLLELSRNEIAPENSIKNGSYINRPIVRVDEARPLDKALIKYPMAHSSGFWFANFLDLEYDPFRNIPQVTYKGLFGPDYHKLELFMNEAEMNKGKMENADLDIFYWHLLDQFWAIKAGVNYFYQPALKPYWQPGLSIEGLMPYFIATDIRAYLYSGSAKLDMEFSRDTQITNNFFIRLGLRSILASKTVERAQIGSGLNQMRYTLRPYYRLMPGLSLYVEYEYQKDYGEFRSLQMADGETANESTLSLGLSLVC